MAGLVPRQLQEAVVVDLTRLPKGVISLGLDARRVALSSTHHLGDRVSVKI